MIEAASLIMNRAMLIEIFQLIIALYFIYLLDNAFIEIVQSVSNQIEVLEMICRGDVNGRWVLTENLVHLRIRTLSDG